MQLFPGSRSLRRMCTTARGSRTGIPDAQYPGDYLPGHTTFDLSLGKNFAEKYSVSVTALNVANRRVELDNSLTFGGFHWNDPRADLCRVSLPVPLLSNSFDI